MNNKYVGTYEAIITAEQQIAIAKQQLTQGDSPYVSLSVARNQCDRAMTLWHTESEVR
jgi:hypothetical protein